MQAKHVATVAALFVAAASTTSSAAVTPPTAVPPSAVQQWAEPKDKDWLEFRGLFKELVETNTTLSAGSCTLAANKMAARLRTAGIPDSNLHIITHPDHPEEGSLVAIYPGSDPLAKAVLMLAHIDVVEAKREDWTHDPFTLIERDGFLYGRGTADDKAMAATGVDSFIRFKQAGFQPRRTLKLALTCGEEGAPFNGAKYLVTHHRDLIDAGFALNEGGFGQLDEAGHQLYQSISVGEKFPQSFTIEATNPGGHGSVPRPDNAIYDMAKALSRIEALRFPVILNPTTRDFLSRVSHTQQPEQSAAIAALLKDPTDEDARIILERNPNFNAILHTTCAPTMLNAGHAANALPQRARLTINCRIIPGESVEQVQNALENAIGNAEISITANKTVRVLSPQPPLDPAILGPAETLAAEMWPGVPFLPTMLAGATDGGFLTASGIPAYGLQGIYAEHNGNGVHGLNEHIRIQTLYEGRSYLHKLMEIYGNQK